MKRVIEAGAFTEEAAALLQSAESTLYGQVGWGGGEGGLGPTLARLFLSVCVCVCVEGSKGRCRWQVACRPAGSRGCNLRAHMLAQGSCLAQGGCPPPCSLLLPAARIPCRCCQAGWPARWRAMPSRTGRQACARSTTRATGRGSGPGRGSRPGRMPGPKVECCGAAAAALAATRYRLNAEPARLGFWLHLRLPHLLVALSAQPTRRLHLHSVCEKRGSTTKPQERQNPRRRQARRPPRRVCCCVLPEWAYATRVVCGRWMCGVACPAAPESGGGRPRAMHRRAAAAAGHRCVRPACMRRRTASTAVLLHVPPHPQYLMSYPKPNRGGLLRSSAENWPLTARRVLALSSCRQRGASGQGRAVRWRGQQAGRDGQGWGQAGGQGRAGQRAGARGRRGGQAGEGGRQRQRRAVRCCHAGRAGGSPR